MADDESRSLLKNEKQIFDEEGEDCCPCCEPTTQRAWVGWSCAFLGCAILEFVGVYAYYHYSAGVAALVVAVMLTLVSYLSIQLLVVALPFPDYAGQNFLFAILIFVAYLGGVVGAVAGGFHVGPYFSMYYGNEFFSVSPDADPLSLVNPTIIHFAEGARAATQLFGRAEFDSTAEHHWDSWRVCVTPIVSEGTYKTINYWAVSEGEDSCEPPTDCPKCAGVVLADDSHARSAADAVTNMFQLEQDPNSIFVLWTTHPESYQEERLILALLGCLVPLLCFPLLAWPLYYVMSKYMGRGVSLCTGVDSKRRRRPRGARGGPSDGDRGPSRGRGGGPRHRDVV